MRNLHTGWRNKTTERTKVEPISNSVNFRKKYAKIIITCLAVYFLNGRRTSKLALSANGFKTNPDSLPKQPEEVNKKPTCGNADNQYDVTLLLAEGVDWPEEEFAPPEDAQDLINLLLQHNSVERLGSGGAHEVKGHLFFDGISWQGLLRQKAEFVPQLEHDEDTSYFDST